MNQSQLILEHLRKHGSITVLEAENPPINCKRLASRIDEIHNGIGVEMAQTWTEMITIPSGKRVAKYHLITESDANIQYEIQKKRDSGITQVNDLSKNSQDRCQQCGSYYRRGKDCNLCQKNQK